MADILRKIVLLVFAVTAAQTTAVADDKVEVKIVKYAGLTDAVEQYKGKVIVVDFWAYW